MNDLGMRLGIKITGNKGYIINTWSASLEGNFERNEILEVNDRYRDSGYFSLNF